MVQLPPTAKRVSMHTSVCANVKIAESAAKRVKQWKTAELPTLCDRLEQLDREWDTERVLETNASALILAGLVLGKHVSRKWLLLSCGVSAFLLQHALQGWCPPLPVIRALGVRTAQEIEAERAAIQTILAERAAP